MNIFLARDLWKIVDVILFLDMPKKVYFQFNCFELFILVKLFHCLLKTKNEKQSSQKAGLCPKIFGGFRLFVHP